MDCWLAQEAQRLSEGPAGVHRPALVGEPQASFGHYGCQRGNRGSAPRKRGAEGLGGQAVRGERPAQGRGAAAQDGIGTAGRMKKVVTVLVVGPLAFGGCSPKMYPHRTESTEHTVTVTETVRDTVVQVRPDSSIVRALIRCDSTGRARLDEIRLLQESSRLQQTLAVESPAEPYQPTAVTVRAVVDSMGIYLTLRERHREEQQTRTVETVVEKEDNVLRWWQTALMWMGGVSLIVILVAVIGKGLISRFK